MLRLRNVDFSAIKDYGSFNVGITFMFGDLIYVIDKFNGPSPMFSIDTETFAIKRVPVVYHDCEIWRYDIDRDIAVVHNGVAFIYFSKLNEMIAGTIVGGKFHWRIVSTNGKPERTLSVSTGAVFQNSAKYAMIVMEDRLLCKYELDLETMQWDRKPTSSDENPDMSGEQVPSASDFCDMHVFATPNKLHAFPPSIYSNFGHKVFDRKSTRWIYVQYDEIVFNPYMGTAFVALNNLYSIQEKKIDCNVTNNNRVLVLYQFDEEKNQWKKIGQFPAIIAKITQEEAKVVVNGSRIYIFGHKNPLGAPFPRELEYLMVFELKPTLVDHAMASLFLQSEEKRLQFASILPRTFTSQIIRDTSFDHFLEDEDEMSEFEEESDSFDLRDWEREIEHS